jgi:hypothetical protein
VDSETTLAKSVSFADLVSSREPDTSITNSERWGALEKEAQTQPRPPVVPRVLELDENDQVIGSKPLDFAPPSTEEIARHRREVLENASTIGPIVATMDIESDDDYDYDEDEEMEDYSSSGVDENDFGMANIRNEFTPEYVADMRNLINKHKQVMTNIGPREAGFSLATPMETIPEPRVPQVVPAPVLSSGESKGNKPWAKGVRFAEELDISESTQAALVAPPQALPVRSKPWPKGAPISDVVERAPVTTPSTAPAAGGAKKRISKFKAARLAGGE